MTELFLHTHTPTHTDSGAHPRSQPFKLPDSGQASHAEQSARFVASTLSCLRPKKRKEKKKAKKTLGFRSRSPKLTASRHVLALKSRCTCLQWSPIVLAVKWATNRPAAAVFVGQNKNRKWEKASGSYRCVFSHCSPSSGFFPPSFGPDLWRSVNSYRAVSLSPSSSLGPMSYFSAAAERGHASSAGRWLWRLKRRDVWHTPSDASILKFAKRAARGRCIFSESPSYVRVHPMNEREMKVNSKWKANFDDISPQDLLKNWI